jgi:predicted metal-dependent hydrolase
MARKEFVIQDLAVTIYKRRGNRNLRLSLGSNGQVRVSIPAWAPYQAGLDFANSRIDWIRHQQKPARLLSHGQAIGKAHHLHFVAQDSADKPSGRVQSSLVIVSHHTSQIVSQADVQQAAYEASVRALRRQAEQLLPQRLATLAAAHGFDYKSVRIKRLKSRWGSCDQSTNIVLNLFLMQLPWELIDYVLLHELVHTRVLRHGPDFWRAMEAVSPDVKTRRQALRQYRPALEVARL